MQAGPAVEQLGEVAVEERVGVVHEHVPALDPRRETAEGAGRAEPLALLDREASAPLDVGRERRLRPVRVDRDRADERRDPLERPVDERAVADRAHRLRSLEGQRPQPGPRARREHDAGDVVALHGHVSILAPASSTSSRRTAPALSSGSLPLPHLGDCTHDGQPSGHSHAAIASRVAVSHVRRRGEAALGEARRRRDGRRRRRPSCAGVLVQRGRDAADVPAVARRDEREQADRRVLGGVGRAGDVEVGEARGHELRRPTRSTTRPACAGAAAAGRAAPRRAPAPVR